MKDDISIQTTDTELSEGAVQTTEIEEGDAGLGEGSSNEQRLPRRYRLYDRFADHVSLRTLDAVILITAVLIIGLLIYGIATGNPQ